MVASMVGIGVNSCIFKIYKYIIRADNDSEGVWKVLLPRNMENGKYLISKQDVVRVYVIDKFGKENDKIPIWASEGKLD